ncbi:NERD domain-containing protein [Maritimibacter sp. UBA3975]|uniref:nuclease-related domain-containing protein n=1 Tax=Maritimibacter sp. UBA3975 TaxID=1946833 RepID=UPI000C0A95CA|nr:NERD domain-containing protein [Maritimibacter sp. UBA3975]MAM61425.1 nuclease [Maritimibacter sp.]
MEAVIIIFFLLVFALGVYLRSPSFKGAAGEARVERVLGRSLPADEYHSLRDITLPTIRGGTTQIDHVVVSRYGVFVVETKNMAGWIFGGPNQARWTQTLHRHKQQFQNPLRQNYKHVKVLQDLLGLRENQIFNVVAFVGDAIPKTPMPRNVVWSERQLAQFINSQRVAVLEGAEVNSIKRRIREAALKSNRSTRQAHIQNVKAAKLTPKQTASACPRCGANMVERTNKRSGDTFLGCSRFPQCRGTRPAG